MYTVDVGNPESCKSLFRSAQIKKVITKLMIVLSVFLGLSSSILLTSVLGTPAASAAPVGLGSDLSMAITASVSSYYGSGTAILYSYAVTNTDSVTLNPVTVTDPMPGLSAITCPDRSLTPAQSETCSATYATTQADVDAGSLTNTATATGTPPTGSNVTASSILTLLANQNQAISITKTASVSSYSAAGTTITYTYKVTNIATMPLVSVTVTDPMPGLSTITCLGMDTPSSNSATMLFPKQSETCSATYITTQADVDAGSLTNTATATGIAPIIIPAVATHTFAPEFSMLQGTLVTASSTVTIPVEQHPAISITKTASVSSYSAPGTTITYSYAVANTGNVTLNPVTVTDPMPGLSTITCPDRSLTPAQSETCSATYITTQADVDAGSLTNIATATGTPPTGSNVTASSTVKLDYLAAATKAKHHKKKRSQARKEVKVKVKKKVAPALNSKKKVLVGSTTVHTGEPWSGATPYLIWLSLFGLLLTSLGVTRRKISSNKI